MYSIYFENKTFIFANQAPSIDTNMIIVDSKELIPPAKLVEKVENNNTLWIISSSAEETFNLFRSQFAVAEAGGGLVECNGKVMMIFRNGRWDLPKGHLEQGETMEQCAIREVEEETGASGLKIVEPLITTEHFHNAYGVWEIKRTHWYLMQCAEECSTPQTEEGISRIGWLRGVDLWQAASGTYTTIRNVFERYIEIKNR